MKEISSIGACSPLTNGKMSGTLFVQGDLPRAFTAQSLSVSHLHRYRQV